MVLVCFYFCFPPRATACGTRVRYWVRAIAGSVGRRRRSSSAGSICISMRRISIPVSPATAATVFSCVASRKTGRSAFECWRELPQQVTGRRHPNVAGLCAVAASGGETSSVELQPAAWGGGELRDPKGRRSSAQFSAPFYWFRAARSGDGPKAQRASPATLRVAKTRPFCKIRPRRALLKQFAASGECNEPCRVCSPPPAGAADCAAQRAASVQPNSPPRVHPTAAPLSLRRFFARLARFIYIRLTAEVVESLL